MCAYNVRKNKRVDYDPPSDAERAQNQLQEIGVILSGLTAMAMVGWLAVRVLL
jgi:hypothetical protein